MMMEREKRELQDDLRYYREKTVTLEEAESRRREQDYNDERRRRRERERERENQLHEADTWPQAWDHANALLQRSIREVKEESSRSKVDFPGSSNDWTSYLAELQKQIEIICRALTMWHDGIKAAERRLQKDIAINLVNEFGPDAMLLADHLQLDQPQAWLEETTEL